MNESIVAPAAATVPASGSSKWLFLRFAGLAGLGWLLDAALLLSLVTLAEMPASRANVVSSCSAAVTVFLLSRQTLFRKASQHVAGRVAGYVVYTLALIAVASLAIGWIVHWAAPLLAGHMPAQRAAAIAAAIGKVIVTPPQLVANFIVARFLSERSLPGTS